jgi:HD-GYP domain-containing protein (c-di-GMP phosphodiesterase class II)
MIPIMDALHGLRILVAGEEPTTLDAARSGLASEGAQLQVCDAEGAAVVAAVTSDPPDVVLALDGSEERIRAGLDPLGLRLGPPVVPVLDVVGPRDPFDAIAARRLSALVQLHALRDRAAELEGVIAAQAVSRRRELDTAQLEGLRRLALAAEYRDDNTHEHTQRVGHLAALLARGSGLGDRMVRLVREAAPLHDLGKIAIPDSILLKPGRLSAEEYEVVKTHALLGARVLSGAAAELLEVAERIVRHHHERWDGAGYPDGLAGEEIPAVARIAAVADVFDVLVHERPYKDSWSVEAAAEEIRKGAGTQFDPAVVEAFDALGPAGWRSEVQPV